MDGACCDTACTGQCEACDVAGVVGVCTPVAGAPHRSRAPCSDGGGDVCKVRECDGVAGHGGSCQGYKNGITTACGSASCANAKYTPAPTCDGAGACVTASCADNLGCVSDTACRTSCVAPTDCALGYDCAQGKCVPKSDKCSDDRSSVVSASGNVLSCSPYVCQADQCVKTCVDSSQCVTGYRCDATGTCVEATADATASEGGCASGGGSPCSGAAFFAVATAALAGLARRRRR